MHYEGVLSLITRALKSRGMSLAAFSQKDVKEDKRDKGVTRQKKRSEGFKT